MNIILATHNKNKVIEIRNILNSYTVLTLDDLNDFDEVEETGKSFRENAFLKAEFYHKKYRLPVIADDSGLTVDALNGEPGIYSARYSKSGDPVENYKLLLENMKNIEDRRAHFNCTICYIDAIGSPHYFEGEIKGLINHDPLGKFGFGYDPIFYLPQKNKTFAELPSEEKNKISHRAIAIAKFIDYIKSI